MAIINARQERFSVNYRHEILSSLFQQQNGDCDFSEDLAQIDCDGVIELLDSARLTLLIAVDKITNQDLIRSLREKADSGVRIYLLLGDEKQNQTVIDSLSGRCLIRTGVNQKGAMIASDHSTSKALGLLVMSQETFAKQGLNSWAVQLDSTQVEDAFRSFCKLFWEDGKNEYLKQNQRNKITPHPNGNIVTNHSYQQPGALSDSLSLTLSSLQGASRSSFESKSSQYTLLLNSDCPLINAGEGVALTDSSIPSLLFSAYDNWLLPDEVDFELVNWCLKLSNDQYQKLFYGYQQAVKEAAWQYRTSVRLGELNRQQLVRFADQPDLVRKVVSFRKIELEPISTQTIDSFLEANAEELAKSKIECQRDSLAHDIEYSVTIHPPYCPNEAKPDELYRQWELAEVDWKNRLVEIKNHQEKVDQHQAKISNNLQKFLKGFLLGQGQSVKKMEQELEVLNRWSVTQATPAERLAFKQRLEALFEGAEARSQKTVAAMDEANQHCVWQEKRKKLEAERDKAASLAKEKQVAINLLDSKKNKRELELSTRFTKSWGNAVKSLTEEQLEKIKLPSAPSVVASRSVQAILSEMDFLAADKWRKSVNEKTFKKYYSNFNRVLTDYQLGFHKIERDYRKVNDELDNALRELKNSKSALSEYGERFIYKPSASEGSLERQLGLNAATSIKSQFKWPKEDLPEKGTKLKNDGKRRWLVIEDTDQLEQARKDSKRLNAIICVNNFDI